MNEEILIKEIASLRRDFNLLKDHNMILQNTLIGIARLLQIPAEHFAEAMIEGGKNSEYESDILKEFGRLTGKKASQIDQSVSQTIKQDKKKHG